MRNYDIARSIMAILIAVGAIAAAGGLMLAVRALVDSGIGAMLLSLPPLLAGLATMAGGFVGLAIFDIAYFSGETAQRLREAGDRAERADRRR